LLPSAGALTSVNPLPGGVPGSVFVARSSGSNPGSSLSVNGGSAAAGSTDVGGGDMIMGGGLVRDWAAAETFAFKPLAK